MAARLRAGAFVRASSSATTAGVTMGLASVVALTWSFCAPESYATFSHSGTPLISNGLMTLFFWVIGLDLGHELSHGSLRSWRQSGPAVLAAALGMAATGFLMVCLGGLTNQHALTRGWGVPMATDIAFSLGVLSLCGSRGLALRPFVLVLAVADDVGSVVALGLTGPRAPQLNWLAALAVVILASALLRSRLSVIAWSVLAMVAWVLCARAGIDPPLSAVAVGVLVPSHTREYAESVWRLLTASVNLVVLPLFALVAVGVNWSLVISTPHGWSFALALAGARIAGKVLGITVGARVGARIAGVAPLGGQTLVATGLICAVGITVPLIFARQAFGTSGLYGLTTATLISVSVMGSVGGIGLLRRARRSRGWVLD